MKTIVIDGVDGTGKETQCKELKKSLEKDGLKVKLVSFPNYQNESSVLLKRYLKGEYGEDPNKINPYSASLFYTVDRLNFFLSEDLENYDILLCDRYTTSNLIHQATKIDDINEREAFTSWLEDLEYNKMKLPEPDIVFYLDLKPEVSEKLRTERNQNNKSDIHESDLDYLKLCNIRSRQLAQEKNWKIIDCNQNNSIKPVETIQKEIIGLIKKELNGQF